jgi:hypothetical protein
MVFPDIPEVESGCIYSSDGGVCRNKVRADNPNTTQTPEYTKDKYNAKIIK